jgi:hypothetical protein
MLGYLLENSDLGALVKLGPQNFLRAVKLKDMLLLANQLRKNAGDEEAWKKAAAEASKLGIPLSEGKRRGIGRQAGERILTLYFTQLLRSRSWVLDFRPSAWVTGEEKKLMWHPSRIFFSPSPEFREGIRSLYRGFYGERDAEFSAGVKRLGLEPAEELLRAHFGLDGQANVKFRLADLQKTFGLVFEACAKAKSTIHPEFAAFGVSLLGLYQTLQESGHVYDVKKAFQSAAVAKRPAA